MNRVYFVLIRFIFLTNIVNCGIIRLGGRETACSHFEIRECTKNGKDICRERGRKSLTYEDHTHIGLASGEQDVGYVTHG